MNWIRRSRRDGSAERLVEDVAAAASVAVSHQTARRDRATTLHAANGTIRRRLTVTAPRLLPRTVQLCIHCLQNPAGFWVSGPGRQTVRRPWCLACCQGLDRDRCAVIPFDR
jgi:hypothetical protein